MNIKNAGRQDVVCKASFESIKKMDDGQGGQKGLITVRASSYGNEDLVGDVFRRGAFDGQLGPVSLPMLWQHDSREVIGKWTKVYESGEFLMMDGELRLGIQRADDAYLNLKHGDIDAVSIGFSALEAIERRDAKGNYEGMDFIKVALMECSVVTFGCNPLAQATDIKGLPQMRELQKLLVDAARDADINVSRRDVEAMVTGAYPGLKAITANQQSTDERDAEGDVAALILSAANQLK